MPTSQGQRASAARGRCPAGAPWGAAWSAHIDGFGAFAGRRERGRIYLIEGAVVELQIEACRISARVQGSRIYHPRIVVTPAPEATRVAVRRLVAAVGRDLAQARLPAALVAALVSPQCALLPRLRDLAMVCTCPDRSRPCKHVFAALYAVASRLDDDPALLFALRGVELDDIPAAPAKRRAPARKPRAARAAARPRREPRARRSK